MQKKTIVLLSLSLCAVMPCRGQVFHRKAAEEPVHYEEVISQEGISETIIEHKGFTVSYNTSLFLPNWVSYELTPDEAKATKYSHCGEFSIDPAVAKSSATLNDYEGTIFVCGQMASPYDMRWSQKALDASFLLSNTCPMHPKLAEGKWDELEQKCRWWAKKYKSPVYIVAGPLFTRAQARYIGENEIVVPDAFFKVVAQQRDGRWVAAFFVLPNLEVRQDLAMLAKPINVGELLTGCKFLRNLPKEDFEKVYGWANREDWDVPGWESK